MLIDPEMMGLNLALRAQDAGHEVILSIPKDKDRKPSQVGDGLVQKTRNWQEKMRWADLVVMTGNGRWSNDIEPYFKKGFPIFGPNQQCAELELNRVYGQQVLKTCGIETMPYTEFDNYDDAEAFVRKTLKRYVSKPHGDRDRALSYVSKNPADMVYMLQRWKRNRPAQEGFMLQEFVSGVEFAVGGWFGPCGWVGPWCESFEHKKLMAGELGVNTGEMGTAVKYVKQSIFAEQVLKPLEEVLHALNYVGYVDVACIIDKKGRPRPLEFTARMGWPLFHIQLSLHQGDPVNWMADLLQGKDTLKTSMDHSVGVVVTLPDFPYSHATRKEVVGVPVYGISKENRDCIQPAMLQKGKVPCMNGDRLTEKELFVSADDYLFIVTGQGKTVKQAKKRSYDVLDEIEIPNSPMWRTDISDKLETAIPELQKFNFAGDWTFG